MRTQQQQHSKLKTPPRPLFSCGFFRHCTQSVISPTNPQSPTLPHLSPTPQPPQQPPPPPPPPPPQPQPHHQPSTTTSSSTSSSTSTSQSFTQWRFPLPASPIHTHPPPSLPPPSDPLPPPVSSSMLQQLFCEAALQLSSASLSDQLAALHRLEHSLVPNPPSEPTCPPELMRGLVSNLRSKLGAKPATKILLALCLAEGNRHVAVQSGAVGTVVEVALELEGPAAERGLAALELMCTVAEGASEIRAHALAVPVMVTMMGNMAGRGREYAISVLAVIYGSSGVGCEEEVSHAPPEEVARAVVLALQGDCTSRGRRKGAQLLKILEEYDRLDLTQDRR
ncbi:hypothetical protein CFOL_v3_32115 [Cephalotus follicularis]|uniref:U-box domain-containing protein n=1 Tax=Cephalotus follicularis TaxID=3775 RepID=A0A1Q3D8Q2_CEPFO|nr:hypothetical protein CFOL_v3_32115 [Cephalotus follicularis]